jgi:uncharacterized protein YciI
MSDEFPPGVEIEQVYLVEAMYTPEAAERRPAVRAEHLTAAAALKRAGTIVEVGAYADGLTSSVILRRADSAEAALAIVHEDVYVRAGVWGEITARPFGRVFPTDEGA